MSVRKSNGFSIIELMMVLLIAAIVTAFAIPGFQDVQRKVRINALSEEVSASLASARSLAVTERRTVYLVALPSGTDKPSSWELHADSTSGTLIAKHTVTSPTTLQLIPCSTCGTTPLTVIKFLPNGVIERNDTSAPVDMTYRICDSSVTTEAGRDVKMNRLGRTFAKQLSVADCNS
jgi:prepilin-type N-terminal cleavage/methylation domain-containing protein